MDDFECVFHDANRHQLLAVIPAVHHQRVGQSLDDGALRLAETLSCISTRRVRKIFSILLLDGDVILRKDESFKYTLTGLIQRRLLRFVDRKSDDNSQHCNFQMRCQKIWLSSFFSLLKL